MGNRRLLRNRWLFNSLKHKIQLDIIDTSPPFGVRGAGHRAVRPLLLRRGLDWVGVVVQGGFEDHVSKGLDESLGGVHGGFDLLALDGLELELGTQVLFAVRGLFELGFGGGEAVAKLDEIILLGGDLEGGVSNGGLELANFAAKDV